jgi:hypothetical protein
MQTSSTDSVIVFGTLQPDGTVRLDSLPSMPPGPIQVTIRRVQRNKRLHDFPVDESAVSTPLDLPRLGTTRMVEPVRIFQHFPDLPQNIEAA